MKTLMTLLAFAAPLVWGVPVTASENPGADADPVAAAEAAFREIQVALTRRPSRLAADSDLMVCERRQPTGSRITVVECATNRFRESTRPGNPEGVTQHRDDIMFQMPLADFRRLEQRFGPLPPNYEASIGRK